MTSVTDNGNLDFGVVGHLGLLTVLIRGHCDLEARGHCLEVFIGAHITILQTWPHRVNIEEWILPVLNVRAWVPVQRLVALIADSRQV